jgi:tryptophan-rich sensory protein
MDYLIKTYPTWATLAGFLLATFAAAASGVFFKPGTWYLRLSKPSWTPPDWLFPIAWTILYIAMAVGAWWVAYSPDPLALPALAFWAFQLTVNALWSPVFFGQQRLGAGFAVITVLWIGVAITTSLFWSVSQLSGLLMLPYLVWVSYAGALNLALWRMNRNPV